MERERLTRLVEEPGNVGRADLSDLNALAERYPWFAGARILRSLGEHKAGDVLSEETLRDTSAHVPSRAALFDLIARAGSVIQPVLTVVPKVEAAEAVKALPTPVAAPEPIALPEFLSAPLQHPGPEAERTPSRPKREPDTLERQIMEAVLAGAYDLTWSERKGPGPSGLALSEGSDSPVANELPVTRIEPVRSVPPEEFRPVVQKGSKLRFTAWLDEGKLTPELTVSRPTTKQRIPDVALDRLRKDPEVIPAGSMTHGPIKSVAAQAPTDTKVLIDRFINQQPPATPKAEFYTPQQAAKRSLDDTAGLVTETLARVYEKQGDLTKAIDAYHRLALKYPAKSAYFAALAKDLEGQLSK